MPEESEEPEVMSNGDGGGPKGPEVLPPSNADDGEEPDASLALMEPAGMPVFRLERMEPADNSAAKKFLEAALGYAPDGTISHEEALKLVRYYGRHRKAKAKQAKAGQPGAEQPTGEAPGTDELTSNGPAITEEVRSAVRTEVSGLRGFAYIKSRADMFWRFFEDRITDPEKEDKRHVHPFVWDVLILVGILAVIVLASHFAGGQHPFPSQTTLDKDPLLCRSFIADKPSRGSWKRTTAGSSLSSSSSSS